MKNNSKSIKLTHKERIGLVTDAILTSLFILIVNFLVFFATEVYYTTHPDWRNQLIRFGNSLIAGNHIQLWSWSNGFVVMIAALDMFVLYIRLFMHYKRIQEQHIINDLHYIADGNFDYTIPYKLIGDDQRIVESINVLVNNVIHSMSEELKTEKSKDELISNVSHDIRTPLTSIIGYLGLIENKQYTSEEDLAKYVHIAYSKARQMKTLADDLFEYTKITDKDYSKLNTRKIEMKAMIDQIAAGFDLEMAEKDMKMHSKTNFDKLVIDGSPSDLARAINNLISNALKYGHDGHNIYVEGFRVNEKELEIKVSNDGEKIPEESIEHVFDRFYRVENSRNKSTGGTGLGLAIVYEVVNIHGGYCSVASNDELTTFTLHLPIKHGDKLTPTKHEEGQQEVIDNAK
ncbi:HAMP domain-containing histidine kinase [Apilactobacillus kunkeei]|nr:HAMP domain-containing sensor histidine kinase [Apilactobacillus kunkeei]KOY74037.1 Two component system histidine kinase [Apilactobacillus kunkeei DSM 12361 = ATCC 700308]QYU53318.1 HAMP domain-containing histidine kinase [Apilactobacillus kunkeei]